METTNRGKKEKSEHQKFLRLMKKIYTVLESDEWKIVLQKIDPIDDRIAFVYWDENLIVLDPRENVIVLLIHECLHILDDEGEIILKGTPSERELKVEALEKFCHTHLGADQAFKLTNLLAQNLCRSKKILVK